MKYYSFLFSLLLSITINAQDQQAPCATKGHHQFDFWVGEWEVFHTQADTVVGYNRIEKTLNGCLVEENWTGLGGFKGKSFNTFNPLDSTWNQVWVDQTGATLHFSGKYENDILALSGQQQTKEGEVWYTLNFHRQRTNRTVRQIWKMSNDEGKTWTTLFDGTYKKKGKDIGLPD